MLDIRISILTGGYRKLEGSVLAPLKGMILEHKHQYIVYYLMGSNCLVTGKIPESLASITTLSDL